MTTAADTQTVQAPSTVLVTGGTGFVGAYVIRDLVNSGYKVKALRRRKIVPRFINPNIFTNVEWIEGDIMDTVLLEETCNSVDAIVHSAAVVSYERSRRQEIFAFNIEGTANIVNAALASNVRKLIHVSSVAALGKKSDGSIVNENTSWQNDKRQSNYSISKNKAEMEVWRGIAEGLHAVIVNPSLILGYGDWNLSSNAIFKNVFNNFRWYTRGVTGFVDVEDVSKAIVQLLGSGISGERFILNGDNWNYQHLLNTIADGFKIKRPSREVTPLLGEIAWRLDSARSFLTGHKKVLTKETVKAALTKTRYENDKIRAALPGFEFTNLDETIRKACSRYLAHHLLP